MGETLWDIGKAFLESPGGGFVERITITLAKLEKATHSPLSLAFSIHLSLSLQYHEP